MAIGDLDGDLDPDIAIVSFNDDKVSWLRNEAPVPCLASDFDESGVVGTADLLEFLAAFSCTELCGRYDINYDRVVDTQDMLLFLAQVGMSC